jgi:hypothetical protein
MVYCKFKLNNLLDIYTLDKKPQRGISIKDNFIWFKKDYLDGFFENCEGFAVYQKGTLCGIGSIDIEDKAKMIYGNSNLTIFKIPKNENELNYILKNTYIKYNSLFSIDDLLNK